MAKIKTTVSLDETLMRHIRVRAARTGRTQSDVMEQAIRQGLGAIDRMRSKNEASEDSALEAASRTVHEIRSRRDLR